MWNFFPLTLQICITTEECWLDITSRQHGWGAFRSGFKECYRRLTQAITLLLTFLLLGAATYVTLIVSRHRYKHLCHPSSKHFTLNKCRELSVPISIRLHNSNIRPDKLKCTLISCLRLDICKVYTGTLIISMYFTGLKSFLFFSPVTQIFIENKIMLNFRLYIMMTWCHLLLLYKVYCLQVWFKKTSKKRAARIYITYLNVLYI